MASGSGPGDVLQASKGKSRFVRLARLLLCGGTTVMRELFDDIVSPANLATLLSNPVVKTRLTDMKTKKILTSPQWQKLYPPPGAGPVQSTSFDITLLFKLLRENVISGLSAPVKGWDDLPYNSDFSLPADMARIKYYRNGIAHGDEKMELREQEFSDYWKEIKDALLRIVGHYAPSGSSTVKDWETAIDKLLTDPLTEDDRKNIEELKSWYLEERDLKEMIMEMKDSFECFKSKEFIVRCVVRMAGVGAWLGGTICVLNLLKDNPEILIEYVKYSIIPTGLAFVSFAFGSIKITLRVQTLDTLDEILKRYNTGQLKEDFERVLITEELKTLANGERIELSVEISEEELMAIRKRLVEEEATQLEVKSFCVLPPKPSHEIIYRLDEGKRLLEKMKHKTTDGITIAYLYGNPGCGKSELARQVGEQFYSNVDGQSGVNFVFTFNASSSETLFHSYIEFTRILGCPEDTIAMVVTARNVALEANITQLRDLALPKLEKYCSWLMIVDNMKDLELVSRYFPHRGEKTRGNGQVLVTTGDSRATRLGTMISFFLSINFGIKSVDAVEILKGVSTFSTEKATISKVVRALDCRPLTLACAAIYMRKVCTKEPSMTWTRFLEEHKQRAAATAEAEDDTVLSYSASMKAAAMMAIEKEMSDNILKLVFQFLSVIAAEPIPLKYAIQYVKLCNPDAGGQVVEARISSCSLVRISADGLAISVHPVVHDCLQTIVSEHKEINIKFLELLKMLKALTLLTLHSTKNVELIFATSSRLAHFLASTRRLQHYVEETLTSEILLAVPSDTKDAANRSLSLISDIYRTYAYYHDSDVCKVISRILQEGMLDENDPRQEKEYGIDQRLATTLNELGDSYRDVGQHEEAIKCFERALAIQEKAYGGDDPCLTTTLNELGDRYRDVGQREEAIKCFERALAIQEKAYDGDDPGLIDQLNKLERYHHRVGQHEEAKKCFERALAIQEKAYAYDDPRLATTLNKLGDRYRDVGQHEEAKKCFERALAIQEKAYSYYDPRLATTLNKLGDRYRDVGQHEETIKCFERALAIQEKAYGGDDPRLATTLNKLGDRYRDVGQHEEAIKCFERALAIQEKTYDGDDPGLIDQLNKLERYHRRVGQYEEAIKCFQRALAIQEKTYGGDDPRLATRLNELGDRYRDVEQHEEAIKCFERALTIQEKAYANDDPRLATTLNKLGDRYRDVGQHEEAIKCFERALTIQEKAYANDDSRLATTLNEMGVSYRDVGQHEEAIKCFERALAIQEKVYTYDDPRLATTLNELGDSYRDVGQHEEAIKCFERALAIQKKVYGDDDPGLIDQLNKLERYHHRVGQHEEAKKCFERALAIQEKAYAYDDPRLATSLNEMGDRYRDVGQHEEAIKCFERALAIQEKACGGDDPRLVSKLKELGSHQRDVRHHEEAIKCFERALAIQEKAYGDDDPRLATTLKEVGLCYRDLAQYEEASKCFERALSIHEKLYERLSHMSSKFKESTSTTMPSVGEVLRPSGDKKRVVRLPRLMIHV